MTEQAVSVSAFCKSYGIGRGTFYLLKERGEAPEHFHIGRRVVIPLSAIAAWEKAQRDKAQKSAA